MKQYIYAKFNKILNNPRMKTLLKVAAGIVVLLVLIGLFAPDPKEKLAGSNKSTSNVKDVSRGEWLETDYFAVKVNKAQVVDHLVEKIDGLVENELLKKEEGNKYVIIDLVVKNTDKESRLMFDGEIVTDDGRKFEQTETVAADGYNLILENINPGVTKQTKLVYKIPANLTGYLYYHPARANDDKKIYIKTL
jgi:hypothetical protein